MRGDIDLGMEAARVPVIAVTGTNGKSTVTTLITAILNGSGVRAEAAGNFGRPLLDVVEEPWDVIVAEISSFQLHTTTAAFRPEVAVLLNVAEDHLDWHGSFEEYTAVKARVFAHQRDDDLLVANLDDPIVRGLAGSAPARVTGVTLGGEEGAYTTAHGFLVTSSGEEIVEIAALPSRMPHDLTNGLAATRRVCSRWRAGRRAEAHWWILPSSTTEWSRSVRLPGWSTSTTRRQRTPTPR